MLSFALLSLGIFSVDPSGVHCSDAIFFLFFEGGDGDGRLKIEI